MIECSGRLTAVAKNLPTSLQGSGSQPSVRIDRHRSLGFLQKGDIRPGIAIGGLDPVDSQYAHTFSGFRSSATDASAQRAPPLTIASGVPSGCARRRRAKAAALGWDSGSVLSAPDFPSIRFAKGPLPDGHPAQQRSLRCLPAGCSHYPSGLNWSGRKVASISLPRRVMISGKAATSCSEVRKFTMQDRSRYFSPMTALER